MGTSMTWVTVSQIKCLCIVVWFIESQAGCWRAIFDLGKLYHFYILFVVLLVFPSNRLVIVLVSCTWIGWEFFCISLWSSSTDACVWFLCGVISFYLLVTRKKALLYLEWFYFQNSPRSVASLEAFWNLVYFVGWWNKTTVNCYVSITCLTLN